LKDGFEITRRQNPEFGGMRFSQLPTETQAAILSFELAVDLLINMPDDEVLDIFSRLNSYAVVLNEQEKINATHFSSFKILADKIGRKYLEYWRDQGILTSSGILRMQEVSLVSDLLIAMREGIKPKKQIRRYYDEYEKEGNYEDDIGDVEVKFDAVIAKIVQIYPEGLREKEFSRPYAFYSLFTAVAHCLYGLKAGDPKVANYILLARGVSLESDSEIQRARNALDAVQELYSEEMVSFSKEDIEFLRDSRRATTDEPVRKRRTNYLLKKMA